MAALLGSQLGDRLKVGTIVGIREGEVAFFAAVFGILDFGEVGMVFPQAGEAQPVLNRFEDRRAKLLSPPKVRALR